MIYKVKEGKHAYKPYQLKIRRNARAIKYTVAMDWENMYDLQDEDQQDWNKGGGLSFNMFTNHRNSAMWAWRYNPVTNFFEIGYYCHINGKIEKSAQPEINVAPLLPFDVLMVFMKDAVLFEFKTVLERKTVSISIGNWGNWSREIFPWFGGNNPAPEDLSFSIFDKVISKKLWT